MQQWHQLREDSLQVQATALKNVIIPSTNSLEYGAVRSGFVHYHLWRPTWRIYPSYLYKYRFVQSTYPGCQRGNASALGHPKGSNKLIAIAVTWSFRVHAIQTKGKKR